MDGFQLVHHKGRKRNWHEKKKKKKMLPQNTNSHDEIDAEKCRKLIKDIRCSMVDSAFWKNFQERLTESLVSNGSTFKEVVLYGIGSIGNSCIARHQLALVLLIVEQLNVDALFYDPVLTEKEKCLMEEFGLKPMPENEECKRRVLVPTIFIMLHCGKAMYNNLLWANWNNLQKICVIGNTFSTYLERIPNRILEEASPYIKHVIPYIKQTSIENTYELNDIFNDSSIHTFPLDLLGRADPTLWELTDEPVNNEDDVEIITKKESVVD